MRYFLALSGLLLITGCSTTTEPVSSHLVDKVDPTKAIRINKSLSLNWETSSQGGAAIRQSGYEHVLGEGEFYTEDKEVITPTGGIDGALATVKQLSAPPSVKESSIANWDAAGSNNKIDSSGLPHTQNGNAGAEDSSRTSLSTGGTSQKKGYSIYELQRWERYCNKGMKMDEADWRFVTTEGIDNIPTGAIGACVPPVYTIDDYISSWSAFCSNKTLKPEQYTIIKNTSRPASFGCGRLINTNK